MKLQGTREVCEVVDVSNHEISNVIHRSLMDHLKPAEARDYDDWFIRENGDVVGVTEYYHGSDSHTVVIRGNTELYQKIAALKLVCKLLKEAA